MTNSEYNALQNAEASSAMEGLTLSGTISKSQDILEGK